MAKKDKSEKKKAGRPPTPVPPTPPAEPPYLKRPPVSPGTDPADMPLSDDEQRFIDEYLVDRKCTMAYMRAMPGCRSYANAASQSREWRGRPNVAREIRRAIQAQSERTQVRADAVIKELARIAFSDIWELYDPDTGHLRPARHIPLEVRKAVSSITISRQRVTVHQKGRTRTTRTEQLVRVTFWDKLSALSKLMSHLGLDTTITPLEALLQALPRAMADAIRIELGRPREVANPSTNGTLPHKTETAETP